MPEGPEQQDALFVNLVLMFQNAAMQQMGKITNPLTGKTERNLDQARFSIDMLEMLKTKTTGNLSSEITKLLDSTLTNLRLNYVDEAGKAARGEGESTPSGAAQAEGTPGSTESGGGSEAAVGEGAGSSSASPGGEQPAAGKAKQPGAEGQDDDKDAPPK